MSKRSLHTKSTNDDTPRPESDIYGDMPELVPVDGGIPELVPVDEDSPSVLPLDYITRVRIVNNALLRPSETGAHNRVVVKFKAL